MLLQSIAMSCSLLALSSTATYAMEEYKVEEGKSKTVTIKPAISASTPFALDPKEIDVCAKKGKAKLQDSEIEARKKAIIEHRVTFFTSDMKADDRTKMIELLLDLTPPQIKAIVANADILFAPDSDRSAIVDGIFQGTPDEINAIAKKADTLFTAQMENPERGLIIHQLLQGAQDRVAALLENADKLLIPGSEFCHMIIDALLEGTPDQIQAIAANADKLFTADMDGADRAQVIREMIAPTEEEIELRAAAIKENIDKFFTEDEEDEGNSLIASQLMRATPDQINEIAANAHKLFTPEMNAIQRYGRIREFLMPGRLFR